VVDLSDRLPGAFAARLFGDYGAAVVLTEPAGGHALRPAPSVGEHSREELAITDSEYDDLVAAGVTGTLDDIASSLTYRPQPVEESI
jgi:hypothetical protein